MWDAETADEIQESGSDKDFSTLRTPGSQDSWIGAEVKVDDIYDLFYTGHIGEANAGFKEKIMAAKTAIPTPLKRWMVPGFPPRPGPDFI